jgi:glycosyltransferase involved in cell wall biosynthesis
MPSLNQARFLPAAIASVFEQDYPEIELVVADGGSTDGTLDLLAEAARANPRLRWRSEPDSGPAQAVNRAIGRVRGTLIGWLNADDLYAPGAIGRAAGALMARPDWIMVYGHGEHVDEAGGRIGPYPTQRPEGPIERFADGCFICQPTVFFRRTLPLLVGPLDESFTASFDFDYWVRAFRAVPGRIGFIDALLARSRLHAGGITARQRRAVALEGIRIVTNAFGTAPEHWMTTYVEETREMRSAPDEIPTSET